MKRPIAITVTLCLSLSYVSAHAARPAPNDNTGEQPYSGRKANRVLGHRFGPHAVGGQSGGAVTPDDSANAATQPEDSRSNHQHRSGLHRDRYQGYPLFLVPNYGWETGYYYRMADRREAAERAAEYRDAVARQWTEEQQSDAARRQRQHEARIGYLKDRREREQQDLHNDRESLRSSNGYAPDSASSRGTAVSFDRETGEIAWPTVLQAEPFDAGRRQLEELAAAPLPAGSDAAADRASEIRQQVEVMKVQLKEQMTQMKSNDYIDAKHFLEALPGKLHQRVATAGLVADARD